MSEFQELNPQETLGTAKKLLWSGNKRRWVGAALEILTTTKDHNSFEKDAARSSEGGNVRCTLGKALKERMTILNLNTEPKGKVQSGVSIAYGCT